MSTCEIPDFWKAHLPTNSTESKLKCRRFSHLKNARGKIFTAPWETLERAEHKVNVRSLMIRNIRRNYNFLERCTILERHFPDGFARTGKIDGRERLGARESTIANEDHRTKVDVYQLLALRKHHGRNAIETVLWNNDRHQLRACCKTGLAYLLDRLGEFGSSQCHTVEGVGVNLGARLSE